MLAWTHLVGSQANGVSPVRIAIEGWRKVPKAYDQAPLAEADRRVLGNHLPFFQELLASEAPGAARGRQWTSATGSPASPRGKSRSVCDGIVRISPGATEPQPDGTPHIRIDLWPTAYRFKEGHRLRLLVTSCSHPRFARNPGSGEPIATATGFRAVGQEIFHDPRHPSALVIPVLHPAATASRC